MFTQFKNRGFRRYKFSSNYERNFVRPARRALQQVDFFKGTKVSLECNTSSSPSNTNDCFCNLDADHYLKPCSEIEDLLLDQQSSAFRVSCSRLFANSCSDDNTSQASKWERRFSFKEFETDSLSDTVHWPHSRLPRAHLKLLLSFNFFCSSILNGWYGYYAISKSTMTSKISWRMSLEMRYRMSNWKIPKICLSILVAFWCSRFIRVR